MALMEELSRQIELTRRLADEAYQMGDYGTARAKYLEALEIVEDNDFLHEFQTENPNRVEKIIQQFRFEANTQVEKCNRHLSQVHFQLGRDLYREREYKKSLDEFETAMDLAPEVEVDFIKAIRKCTDRTKFRLTSALLLKNAAPLALKGDDYLERGEYSFAIDEFKQALELYHNAPQYDHDAKYLRYKIMIASRHLVSPYLKQAKEAREFGNNQECQDLLQKALLLLSENDKVVEGFIQLLLSEAIGIPSGQPLPEIKNPKEWEEKITAFEEARDHYYNNLSQTSWLPLDSGTFITREMSPQLFSAQIELAELYELRAEELFQKGFKKEAGENLNESLNLYEGANPEKFNLLQNRLSHYQGEQIPSGLQKNKKPSLRKSEPTTPALDESPSDKGGKKPTPRSGKVGQTKPIKTEKRSQTFLKTKPTKSSTSSSSSSSSTSTPSPKNTTSTPIKKGDRKPGNKKNG